MKSTSILQILMVVIGCGCNGLENEKVPGESESPTKGHKNIQIDCLQVSYVSGICGEAVLKIEDPRFIQYGESWNGHANVFFGQLDCSFTDPLPKETKFYVSIHTDRVKLDFGCAQCLATVDYQGSKRYFITKVGGCNGQ